MKYLLEDEQTKLNKVSRVFMGLPKNPLLSYVFSILSLYNFINMYVYIYICTIIHTLIFRSIITSSITAIITLSSSL